MSGPSTFDSQDLPALRSRFFQLAGDIRLTSFTKAGPLDR